MEETTTSWKNHSFTLLVFGGIVVLCSIFFVLGMLVGRTQGQKIAETAYAEKEKNKPASVASADDFMLNYYPETTDEKDLKLQPAPPEPPPPSTSAQPAVSDAPRASGGSSSSARSTATTAKSQPAAKAPTSTKAATPEPTKPKTSAPANNERYLQVLSTMDQKKANVELKKLQSKKFRALINSVTLGGQRWHRVVVGPYKESELGLATTDLKATGYKDVVPR
jgi:cell division protein FtsN